MKIFCIIDANEFEYSDEDILFGPENITQEKFEVLCKSITKKLDDEYPDEVYDDIFKDKKSKLEEILVEKHGFKEPEMGQIIGFDVNWDK